VAQNSPGPAERGKVRGHDFYCAKDLVRDKRRSVLLGFPCEWQGAKKGRDMQETGVQGGAPMSGFETSCSFDGFLMKADLNSKEW
jgi:hypothetical protein